ncbi:MAG TPA: hypothetical protein VE777_02760 [Gaiellales bacterium]|nr:hypothetical protein [Gaiellales bacterium]
MPDRFPEYLDELELPGEAEIHQQIADLKGELAAATAKVDGLNHWKLLVGELSGDPFKNLVVEALNLVLEGTGYVAEDRPDAKAEDFWLVRRGVDFALCEAKGIDEDVRRQDVGQLEVHRENAGREVGEMPGLLVMNVLRTRDLEHKRSPVSDDVAQHAARLNVVVLRAWDLYGLVNQHLAGETSGRDQFIDVLSAGGGWLEIDGGRTIVHIGGSWFHDRVIAEAKELEEAPIREALDEMERRGLRLDAVARVVHERLGDGSSASR